MGLALPHITHLVIAPQVAAHFPAGSNLIATLFVNSSRDRWIPRATKRHAQITSNLVYGYPEQQTLANSLRSIDKQQKSEALSVC